MKRYSIRYKNSRLEKPTFSHLSKRKHFDKLCEVKVLKHKHIKQGGSFSYYAYGINYDALVYLQDDTPSTNLDNPSTKLDKGCDKITQTPSTNLDNPYDEFGLTKINLLNNSSTKSNTIYNNIKNNINSIISYLNLQAGVMYKVSNSRTINLIKARLKDGFTVDDFKTVIDKKVKAWKGTAFEQYLTPFTLFGDKFEIYLKSGK